MLSETPSEVTVVSENSLSVFFCTQIGTVIQSHVVSKHGAGGTILMTFLKSYFVLFLLLLIH